MPINVNYGPNMALAGQAAFLGAQAQRQQEDERIARDRSLRERALKLQEAQFAQSAYDRDRAFDYQVARDRNALMQRQQALQSQWMQNMANRQSEWDKMQFQADQNAQQMAMGQDIWQDRAAIENQYRKEQDQAQWDHQSVATAEQSALDLLSQYRKMPLSEEGRQILRQFEGRLRAAQAQRADVRDGQYGEIINEIMEDFTNKRIDDFVAPEPTPEEIVAKHVVWQDDYDMLIVQPDGKLSLQGKSRPPAPKAEKEGNPLQQVVQTPLGPMTQDRYQTRLNELFKEERSRLREEWKVRNEGAEEGAVVPEPTDEDILRAVEKREDAIAAHMRKRGIGGVTEEKSAYAQAAEQTLGDTSSDFPPVPADVPEMSRVEVAALVTNKEASGYFTIGGVLYYKPAGQEGFTPAP